MSEVYWSHSLHDLKTMTRLHVSFELTRAMSITESLMYAAGQVFGGSKSRAAKRVGKMDEALDFARLINGGR